MIKDNHSQLHKDKADGNKPSSIVELLPTGKENAVETKALAHILGDVSIRELRSRIAEERKKGAVICSSPNGGYYLPASRKEILEFYQWASKQARSINLAIQSAHRALELPEGQQELIGISGGEFEQK